MRLAKTLKILQHLPKSLSSTNLAIIIVHSSLHQQVMVLKSDNKINQGLHEQLTHKLKIFIRNRNLTYKEWIFSQKKLILFYKSDLTKKLKCSSSKKT